MSWEEIGRSAKPGEIYTLTGDLGVGKTVFTQGVAAGLDIREPVNSPTFTILQIYEEGRLLFTTSMSTGLLMWRRWRRLGMKIIFTARASV